MLWVTGKNGLLGSILAKKCELATGREVDISNLDQLRSFVQKHPGITHVINCAAYSLVDSAEKEKEDAFNGNAIGPFLLALITKEIGAKLIHISTDYVFDGKIGHPLKETDPTSPMNYYAKTKLEGEQRVLQMHPSSCVIRTSWIFGPGGKNFVAKLFDMLMTQDEIYLSDDQWGRPTYVHDLSDALLNMLDQTGVYHYANSGETTKYRFGCAMREEAIRLGFPVVCKRIIPVPSSHFASPCKRPAYSAFDTTKIESMVKIRPWQESLREYLCSKQAS